MLKDRYGLLSYKVIEFQRPLEKLTKLKVDSLKKTRKVDKPCKIDEKRECMNTENKKDITRDRSDQGKKSTMPTQLEVKQSKLKKIQFT